VGRVLPHPCRRRHAVPRTRAGELPSGTRPDFSAYRAGFFSQSYVKLAPATDEVVAGQPLLPRLFRATVPATVAFAVRQLAVVDKAGALAVRLIRRGDHTL
jgi:hypothetical protein